MSTTSASKPRAWLWDEDGDHLEGRFVKFGKATTVQGESLLVVLQLPDDEPVSLFLFSQVLYSAFERQIRERPSHDLVPGELITVERLGTRDSKNGYRYRDFSVSFEHEHKPSAQELFTVDRGEAKPEGDPLPSGVPESPVSEEPTGDDIPF